MPASLVHAQGVTLGLDPRCLYLTIGPPVQSPRVKPEGDGRWAGQWARHYFTP